MFVLLTIDIGNERWTKSGFLTRLSNGGLPQVPGTHAGTRGVGEFDGIIAAVYEDETYYHRDQCDMITMILRLAAEPAWRYERGRQTAHTAGAAGRLEVRNPSHRSSLPLREGAVSSSVLQGSSVILRIAHPSAHGVPYYRDNSNKTKKRPWVGRLRQLQYASPRGRRRRRPQ